MQFINTFYRAISDKFWKENPDTPKEHWLPPQIIPTISLPGPLAPFSVGPIDFFEKLSQVTDPTTRLDVIRELFRILLPNGNAFSKLNEDASEDNLQVRHIWAQMMIQQQPIIPPLVGNIPDTNAKIISFFNYRLNPILQAFPGFYRYPGFETVVYPDTQYHPNPPSININQNINPKDFMDFSPFDNNPIFNDGKVIDKYNPKAQPTYNNKKIDDGALPFPYYPFGTSYRSCPGELFNYYLTELLIDKFSNIKFEYREIQPPCNPDHPDVNRYIAIAPRTSVFDNLYVILK
jgi:hypothetical protein